MHVTSILFCMGIIILREYLHLFTSRVEKLTEVIAELRQPSSLSQPTSNPVAESTQLLPPPTSASSNEADSISQSLATTILPLVGEDSQMSCNISVLDLRDDADTLYKCLCVACALLKELKIKKLSPTLLTLVDCLVRLVMCVCVWGGGGVYVCVWGGVWGCMCVCVWRMVEHESWLLNDASFPVAAVYPE